MLTDSINKQSTDKRAAGRSLEPVLLVCLILAGLCLRFTHLDEKVYWYDEAFSSIEISGYSPDEAKEDILTGRLSSQADLDKYQFPSDRAPKTTLSTIRNLSKIEPQLTPAYFILLRSWSMFIPGSIAAIRALSAVFSVCALAAVYLLCRELFPSSIRVARWCVALLAVSPLQLLYAQEARPYAMWCATVILSSALLLRAQRRPSPISWLLYGLSAALSLYTFLFSVLVLAGHALYVGLENRFRLTAVSKGFVISLGLAFVSFLAWPYRGQHSGAGNDHYSLVQYLTKSLRSIGILFADFNLRKETSQWYLVPYSALLITLAAFCAYCIYFLWRRGTPSQARFVVILVASTIVPLTALDLLQGSSVALVTRYIMPSTIGLQVAIAYFFGSDIGNTPGRALRECSGTLILLVGLASSITMVSASEWWSKDPENYIQDASRIINASEAPVLVLSDAWFVPVLSMEHKLAPGVTYKLMQAPSSDPTFDAGTFKSIFAFKPSAALRTQLSKGFKLELADKAADLWKVKRLQLQD